MLLGLVQCPSVVGTHVSIRSRLFARTDRCVCTDAIPYIGCTSMSVPYLLLVNVHVPRTSHNFYNIIEIDAIASALFIRFLNKVSKKHLYKMLKKYSKKLFWLSLSSQPINSSSSTFIIRRAYQILKSTGSSHNRENMNYVTVWTNKIILKVNSYYDNISDFFLWVATQKLSSTETNKF